MADTTSKERARFVAHKVEVDEQIKQAREKAKAVMKELRKSSLMLTRGSRIGLS